MNVSAASLALDSSVRKATPSDITERTARSGAVVETIFLSRPLRAQCKDSTADQLKPEIRAAMRSGCECCCSCFSQMKLPDVYDDVTQIRDLEKVKKDMYIMGLLDATHWGKKSA